MSGARKEEAAAAHPFSEEGAASAGASAGEEAAFAHTSVLLEETVDALRVRQGGVYVDGTLGGGGHAERILRLGGRLLGIDQDDSAISAAGRRLQGYGERFCPVRANFRELPGILAERGIARVDGILLDLGVSSHQLDQRERGFSYRFDAPLDMRMDRRQSLTAADIVNGYSQQRLFEVIRDYGEDRFAANIAHHIVLARERKPIETTFELNEIIRQAIPARMREKGGHPSRRTFQALRIACNGELDVLRDCMDPFIGLLSPGARFAVITFHSLEDRIVKGAFARNENPCVCPPSFPVCVCGRVSQGHVVTKKPVTAGEEELASNPRARSARLRVFERASQGGEGA